MAEKQNNDKPIKVTVKILKTEQKPIKVVVKELKTEDKPIRVIVEKGKKITHRQFSEATKIIETTLESGGPVTKEAKDASKIISAYASQMRKDTITKRKKLKEKAKAAGIDWRELSR